VLTPFQIYQRLIKYYGHQHWWPADSPFEVMVGAVLTQNTSWTNVEKAINNLSQQKLLDCTKIVSISEKKLASHIRPVGYFNVKAKRLKNFCIWYQNNNTESMSTDQLRHELLSINGVGPETADDILLYACERPVFVIDAYTRRLFQRLGLIEGEENYEELRHWFEEKLKRHEHKVSLFNEYHALIVRHAKEHCRARTPLCEGCCLNDACEYY
jgi:endonuclease-3 related protein